MLTGVGAFAGAGLLLRLAFGADEGAVAALHRLHIAAGCVMGMGADRLDTAGVLGADMAAAPAFLNGCLVSACSMDMAALLSHGGLGFAAFCVEGRHTAVALRALRHQGRTLGSMGSHRAAGAGHCRLGRHIAAAFPMDMVTGHTLHSRGMGAAQGCMVVDTNGHVLLRAAFRALVGAGLALHRLHIAALVIVDMVDADLLCHSRHGHIR